MSRTIVVSDLHGRLDMFETILEHSEFVPSQDTLIIAGDTCDIGHWKNTLTIHALAEEMGAIQLVGNHEIAHAMSMKISPYDRYLDYPEVGYPQIIALMMAEGKWKIAHAFEDILISHAGISNGLMTGTAMRNNKVYAPELVFLYESNLFSPKDLASKTAEYLNSIAIQKTHINAERQELYFEPSMLWTDWLWPMWFRPYDYVDNDSVDGFFNGFRQIVGHTPEKSFNKTQRDAIAAAGVTMIDPYSREHFDKDGYGVYALIETIDDKVTITRVNTLF